MADRPHTPQAGADAISALNSIVSGTKHVAQYAKDLNHDPADWNEDVRELEGWVPHQVDVVRSYIDSLLAMLADKDAEIERLRGSLRVWCHIFPAHRAECHFLSARGCTCGLEAAHKLTTAALAGSAAQEPAEGGEG